MHCLRSWCICELLLRNLTVLQQPLEMTIGRARSFGFDLEGLRLSEQGADCRQSSNARHWPLHLTRPLLIAPAVSVPPRLQQPCWPLFLNPAVKQQQMPGNAHMVPDLTLRRIWKGLVTHGRRWKTQDKKALEHSV